MKLVEGIEHRILEEEKFINSQGEVDGFHLRSEETRTPSFSHFASSILSAESWRLGVLRRVPRTLALKNIKVKPEASLHRASVGRREGWRKGAWKG